MPLLHLYVTKIRLWFHYVTIQSILKYHNSSHKAEWASMSVSKVQEDVIRAFGEKGVEILTPLQVSQFELSKEDENEEDKDETLHEGSPNMLSIPSIDMTSSVISSPIVSSHSTLSSSSASLLPSSPPSSVPLLSVPPTYSRGPPPPPQCS